jgi:hypothetical protein
MRLKTLVAKSKGCFQLGSCVVCEYRGSVEDVLDHSIEHALQHEHACNVQVDVGGLRSGLYVLSTHALTPVWFRQVKIG